MLTREQLHAECRKIFDALPDRGETIDGVDDAVLKLNKQAAMAIDLAAKLDKVREWCGQKPKVFNDYAAIRMNCQQEILSTLGEKGE
jgi:hypothetical protein